MFNILNDPLSVAVIVLAVMVIVLLIAVIVTVVRMRKLYRRYDMFMRGKDAESLEDDIFQLQEDVKDLRSEDRANKDMIKALNHLVNNSYQKTGVVRYDAFKGMGGRLSFALTLLDRENNGLVLNCIHNREDCYLYLKEIKNGECESALSEEEKKSLETAIDSHR